MLIAKSYTYGPRVPELVVLSEVVECSLVLNIMRSNREGAASYIWDTLNFLCSKSNGVYLSKFDLMRYVQASPSRVDMYSSPTAQQRRISKVLLLTCSGPEAEPRPCKQVGPETSNGGIKQFHGN
ncbi:hypothetical protein CY34DRAFT_453806 [Suillus luteus UH-Slu-Lm8-n1]|uniref:Uncharacterized protein n=1 Tax=Suillus luteus UH-Slu-Lm8-n1 TaxID=930992 RepID=A0A0D0A7F6_9AGAM|nr:hypothetical protein CY34DRAFT_453806 [Suillus luteus UH-Slu-Lm8-n1]